MTFRTDFYKKYKLDKKESFGIADIATISKLKKSVLQAVYNRGIGAYKTNPKSVRPQVKSKEQWGYGRVYGFVMKNPKQVGKGKPDYDLWIKRK